MELYSARSPADRAVDWRACFCVVLAGGTCWPWFATKTGVRGRMKIRQVKLGLGMRAYQ